MTKNFIGRNINNDFAFLSPAFAFFQADCYYFFRSGVFRKYCVHRFPGGPRAPLTARIKQPKIIFESDIFTTPITLQIPPKHKF
jgi:hypothetical protein